MCNLSPCEHVVRSAEESSAASPWVLVSCDVRSRDVRSVYPTNGVRVRRLLPRQNLQKDLGAGIRILRRCRLVVIVTDDQRWVDGRYVKSAILGGREVPRRLLRNCLRIAVPVCWHWVW